MRKITFVTLGVWALLALITGLVANGLYNLAYAGEGKRVVTLSDKNTVILNLPIFSQSARDVQLALSEKSRNLGYSKPIYLFLNSPGGSIASGEEIIETAKGLPQKVHTISNFSASMSFIISQLLDDRLVLDSATLMSHRAYGGVEGEIPGSIVYRLVGLLEYLTRIDNKVAKRAGMALADYRKLTQDELWMDSFKAKTLKFADETVVVRCDSSLQGTFKQQFSFGPIQIEATFAKCPLISEAVDVKAVDRSKKSGSPLNSLEIAYERAFRAATSDRAGFIQTYLRSGEFSQLVK